MVFKVKEYRMEIGMSQEELSEKSGVSRAIISGLESGRIKDTRLSTLNKLASSMGKKISDLFNDQLTTK